MLIRKEFFIFRRPQGLKFNLRGKSHTETQTNHFLDSRFQTYDFRVPKNWLRAFEWCVCHPSYLDEMCQKSRLENSKKKTMFKNFQHFPTEIFHTFCPRVICTSFESSQIPLGNSVVISLKTWLIKMIFGGSYAFFCYGIWIFTERFDFGSFETVKGDAFEGMPKTWSLIRLIKIH